MKPSDCLKQGICPFCCGDGEVHSIIEDRLVECVLCKGTKRWPPPDDPSWQSTQGSDGPEHAS
jgi:hypothetical protein